MNELKKVVRRLWLEYIVFWLLAAGLFLSYELGWMELGMYAGDPRMEYLLQTVGILLTLCLIPLSLKLFGLAVVKRISALPLSDALHSYQRWSEIRLSLLTGVVLLNLSIYYWTLSSIGGLCAVLGLLASLFCLPNEKRVKEDLKLNEE